MKTTIRNHSQSTKISDLFLLVFSIAYFLIKENKEKKMNIPDISISPTEFYEQ